MSVILDLRFMVGMSFLSIYLFQTVYRLASAHTDVMRILHDVFLFTNATARTSVPAEFPAATPAPALHRLLTECQSYQELNPKDAA